MADPRLNPNADPEERKCRMAPLIQDLANVLAKHGEPIGAVAEDAFHFYRSLMVSFYIAVLSVQGRAEPDKTMTVKDHMTDQFLASKAAFSLLAAGNQDKWNKPVEMEGES